MYTQIKNINLELRKLAILKNIARSTNHRLASNAIILESIKSIEQYLNLAEQYGTMTPVISSLIDSFFTSALEVTIESIHFYNKDESNA